MVLFWYFSQRVKSYRRKIGDSINHHLAWMWGLSPGGAYPRDRRRGSFACSGLKHPSHSSPHLWGKFYVYAALNGRDERSQIGRHAPMYERHPSRRSQSIASNTHQMAVIFSSQADPVNVKAYSFSNAAMGAWSCATLDVPGASSDELLMSKKLLLVISIPSAQG